MSVQFTRGTFSIYNTNLGQKRLASQHYSSQQLRSLIKNKEFSRCSVSMYKTIDLLKKVWW